LWIDEIEKAFASASSDSADGGLSQRMFGTLLSWMQDHRAPIFLIATANNLSQLPPELMRKGRFDEIFFVDLPSEQERAAILSIQLRRRGRDPAAFPIGELAQATAQFSGAELEQVVVAGLYDAFADGVELEPRHLTAAVTETRPLAVTMAEDVARLREWAKHRTRAAS
jgi:SpoVK/Ycf46/Vps4 family AAA+-type ATPase